MIKRIELMLMMILVSGAHVQMFADVVIPFTLQSGLILIDADVDGRQGKYIYDSGCNTIVVDQSARRPLSQSLVTGDGVVSVADHKIGTLKIGEMERFDLLAYATDLSALDGHAQTDIHGIIGGYLFNRYAVKIDFVAKQIILQERDSSYESLTPTPIKLVDDIPLLTIDVNGQELTFILDSGASAHFMDPVVAADLGAVFSKERTMVISTAGAVETRSVKADISSRSGDPLASHFYLKNLQDATDELGQQIDGILSLSSIDVDRLVIDLPAGKVWW